MHMPVVGVLSNVGVRVAEVAADEANEGQVPAAEAFSANTDAVGYDWKTFDRTSGTYTIEDRVYFVRRTNDALWQLSFTGFSRETALISFTKQLISTPSLFNRFSSLPSVYPNPLPRGGRLFIRGCAHSDFFHIFTQGGRQVHEQACDVRGWLVPDRLSTGTYFVEFGGTLPSRQVLIID